MNNIFLKSNHPAGEASHNRLTNSEPRLKAFNPFILALFFLILLFPYSRLQAQEAIGLPFVTDYTQLKTGFYGIDIQAIQQGNNGMIYFGSVADGNTIVQYDGVNWSTVPSKNTGEGVTRCMAKDSTGTIFYGDGLDFGYLSRDSTGQTVCISLLQYVPKEDKRGLFQIWSVQAAGNSVYFEESKRLFRLTKTGTGKNASWVCKTWDSKTGFGYLFYLDNTLYVREREIGLLKMVDDSLQLTPGSEFLGKQSLAAMLPIRDSAGKKEYLLGTPKNGLYLFDGKHFTPFHTQAAQWLKGNSLHKAIIVNKGDYALGIIGAGVIIINSKGKVLQIINKKSGLTSNSILSLFWDGHHNLWVGMDNGICKVALDLPFTRFFNQPGLTSIVKCMAKLPDGSLYAGTNYGVAKYNPVTAQFESTSSLPKGQIFSMVPDGNELLVGGAGLYVVQGNKVSLVKNNTVTGQLLISKKYPNMLYAVTNSGLEIFVRDKSYTGGWRYLGKVPGLPSNNVFAIAEQPDGKLWGKVFLGTVFEITFSMGKNGIPLLAKTKVEKFQAGKVTNMEVYPSFFKNKIIFWGDNSSSAAYAYNDVLKKFIKDTVLLTAGDTLESSRSGLNGIMWAYSQRGKYEYYTSSETDERYRIDTSLWTLIDDFGGEYIHPGNNGIIWFPALDGLIRYDTKIPINNTFPFNVLIRKITSGKTRFNPYPSGNKVPEIKYSHHTFRFDYAAPYFLNESKTQYQTRLQGFDTAWSAWGRNTYKEYTNLPYGKYEFKVRAKNVLGTISREADYSFIILPPWYSTWWAYIIYALIIIAIVWRLIAYRSRNLKRKNQQLEQKVSQRTNELQESLENLKSTQKQLIQSEKMASLGELTAGIAHEIQNPLNFVNNFSEVNTELIEELKGQKSTLKSEEQDELLDNIFQNNEKILHHGKRADAIVKGMLQHSRGSSGQRELTDINALADEYLRLSYHGMRAKDKSFNATMKTDFDGTIGKINIVPQDIGRVLLNLFNNAFYACTERSRSTTSQKQKAESLKQDTGTERNRSADYQPTVSVSTKKLDNKIEIKVKDKGNGIPEKVLNKIFQPFFTTKPTGEGTGLGLSLSYDIIKAHDGEIKVETKQGEGSEFTVILPV